MPTRRIYQCRCGWGWLDVHDTEASRAQAIAAYRDHYRTHPLWWRLGYLVWPVREGEAIPWWLGVVRRDYTSDRVMCMPIPLNIVARWWHRLVWWAKSHHPNAAETALFKAYRDGYRHGRADALRAGPPMPEPTYYYPPYNKE